MKYKLLKDLPWVKAGTICENTSNDDFGLRNMWVPDYGNIGIHVATFSDWFEEVDERWKPKLNSTYFYLNPENEVNVTTWDEYLIDSKRFRFGNCFKTQEKAKQAAEQIKALLKEFHKNNP